MGPPDIDGLELPPAVNPARHPAWGMDSFVFFPNFMLLIWAPNWYLTYHYWPTSYNTHIFEGDALLRARRRTARERLRQELAAVTFKEYAPPGRQHPRGDPVDDRVAGGHRVPARTTRRSCCATCTRRAARYVADYQKSLETPVDDLGRVLNEETTMTTSCPTEFADLEPFADWCLRTEAERYAKRLASTMDEMQAFYDAAFPRLGRRAGLPRRATARRAARRRRPSCCGCATRWCTVSFPVEVWRQPRVPDSGAATMDAVIEPAV